MSKKSCAKCGMTFRIGKPYNGTAVMSRCAEPGCNRLYGECTSIKDRPTGIIRGDSQTIVVWVPE
jgi:hypothetical protein